MSIGPVVVAVPSPRDPPLLHGLVQRIHEGRNTVALVHHDPRGVPHGLAPSHRTLLMPDPNHCDWGRMNLAEGMLRLLDETRRCSVPIRPEVRQPAHPGVLDRLDELAGPR